MKFARKRTARKCHQDVTCATVVATNKWQSTAGCGGLTVDVGKCVAAGQCVVVAPEVFDQREEDGVVILLTETPAAELH